MKRVSYLVLAAFFACHKHEDTPQFQAVAASATATELVASPTPSADPPVATASAGASAMTPEALASAERLAARRHALEEAAQFGVLGAMSTDGGERGNMFGEQIGDAFGAGGLGLRGTGAGGGTPGGGMGTLGGRHTGPTPTLRQGATTSAGACRLR